MLFMVLDGHPRSGADVVTSANVKPAAEARVATAP